MPQLMHACMQHIARTFLNHEGCFNPRKIWSRRYVVYSGRLRCERMGNKNRCCVFYHPHKPVPVLQQIRLLTGLNMDGKTCKIAIQLVLLQCCRTSDTFFVARFSLPLGGDERFFWLRSEKNLINSVLY